MAFEDPAIPKGSTVLVTGASGWVGSNVADQFLAYGYKVRGTTRDVNKAAWMKETFEKKYGSGVFELVSVPDMVADGAYDEAVKGKLNHVPLTWRLEVLILDMKQASPLLHTRRR